MAQADSATASTIKAEKNIAKMSCIMVSLFLFAWTPYSITASLGAFGPQGLISKSVAIYPSLFAKASCLYNAWIYIGMNKAVIKSFVSNVFILKLVLYIFCCFFLNEFHMGKDIF